MKVKPFALERYFAKYEFSAKYMLSSSDCDGLVMKDLIDKADEETKKLWTELRLGYTESLGLPLLREEIAKIYQDIKPENVLVTVPEEGIFIALNSILESGNEVITTYPGYQSLYEVAESMGCKVIKWQPDEFKGWRFDPEFLSKNINDKTKLIVFNFPHNPTGYLPTREEFEQIIAIAKEKKIYVLSDEMYRFLEYETRDRLSSAGEIYENAVSLFGMSKTFGMAGARIGWLVTKNKDLYQRMANFKDYVTICSSAPSEILSLMALRDKDGIIQNHLLRIKRNLDLLTGFFEKYKQLFEWTKPKAGTIAFVKIKMGTGSLEFAEDCVKESGIMVLPSTVYGYGDSHLRIGYGRENIPEVLGEFEKYIQKYI